MYMEKYFHLRKLLIRYRSTLTEEIQHLRRSERCIFFYFAQGGFNQRRLHVNNDKA